MGQHELFGTATHFRVTLSGMKRGGRGLSLKIEGQSWLVDSSVDRDFMKIGQLGRLTKKEPERNIFNFLLHFGPHRRRENPFSKILGENSFNYRLAISNGLSGRGSEPRLGKEKEKIKLRRR